MFESSLYCLLQSLRTAATHTDTIHHQLNVMSLIAVELHVIHQFTYLTVDTNPQETLLGHVGKQLTVVTLATFHQRCQYQDILALIALGDQL